MTPNPYLWLLPILPLAGAAINGFFGRHSSKKAITAIALTFCGAAFVMALWIAVPVFVGLRSLLFRSRPLDSLRRLPR